jgi:hypothetical protein
MADPSKLRSFSKTVDFLNSEITAIEVHIKGYSVTGGGTYSGDLLCTGLTHW